jgi:uncharacterized Ntn-hydrolase superfamily protein
MDIATFSIAACDLEVEEWGVAVASKFLAAGAVVPWARAKAGAIATQALANLSYGLEGLERLEKGSSAEEIVEAVTSADEGREHRQLGVVDSQGGAATYTGKECFEWAGGVTGDGFAAQGNILTGPDVVESMKEAFEAAEGPLADRMLQSLLAGDRTGGDRRGRQSAGILVVREGGSYGGFTDRALDLRVDDHPDPVPELVRLRGLHRLYLEAADPEDVLELDDATIRDLQDALAGLGALGDHEEGVYDESTSKALRDLMGVENLEMRWVEGERIDSHVLGYIKDKAAREVR